MKIKIKGTPFAHRKSRGRREGAQVWTEAVIARTKHLRPVKGACTLRVTFFLPPDKFPTDHPYGMDLDNLLKRFLDALQRTVFRNVPGKDGCVVEVWAKKVRVASHAKAGALLEIRAAVA